MFAERDVDIDRSVSFHGLGFDVGGLS
jgi:hypothetical protein